jgi:hypothetical protein
MSLGGAEVSVISLVNERGFTDNLYRPTVDQDRTPRYSKFVPFTPSAITKLTALDLQHQLNQAQATANWARYRQLAPLVATAEGRFDFAVPGYLNMMNPDIETTTFEEWFLRNWHSIP